jgi:GDP-L-fucose synthase
MVKNILITGSGGFIGRNLKEFLADKYTIISPRSYELDLCNKKNVIEFFKLNKIDFIIHCATVGGVRGIQDAKNTLDKNISMVNNLIEAKHSTTHIILFGSGAMYEKQRPLHKISETNIGDVIPQDLYGLSKLKISELVKIRNDILCLNIFGCYGKYEKDSRFPTYAIIQNIKQLPIIINQNVVFDYLYIEDLCKIVYYFIKNKTKDKIINVTPTQSISLVEIAKIINKIGNYKSEIIIKNKELNYEYTGNNSVLLNNLQMDFTPYEKGLKNLYEVLNGI